MCCTQNCSLPMTRGRYVRCSTCRGRTTASLTTVLTSYSLSMKCVSVGLESLSPPSYTAGLQSALYHQLCCFIFCLSTRQFWSTLNQFQTDKISVLLICTNGKLHRWTNTHDQRQPMKHIVKSCSLTRLTHDVLLQLHSDDDNVVTSLKVVAIKATEK